MKDCKFSINLSMSKRTVTPSLGFLGDLPKILVHCMVLKVEMFPRSFSHTPQICTHGKPVLGGEGGDRIL